MTDRALSQSASYPRRPGNAFAAAMLVLSLSSLLACSHTTSTPSNDTPTVLQSVITRSPSGSQPTPSSVGLPVVSSPTFSPTAIQKSDCGTIVLQGGMVINGQDASNTGTCFYQGFQQCRPDVTLHVTENIDPDTTNATTYSVEMQGTSCIISVLRSATVIIQRGTGGTPSISKGVPSAGGTCTGLSRDAAGVLHFSQCTPPIRETDVPTDPCTRRLHDHAIKLRGPHRVHLGRCGN
jgi:hypothetical protein